MLSLFSRWRRALLSLLLVGLILVGLSACAVSDRPSRGVLLSALGQQIQLTQTAIAQSLDLQASGVPEVSRVRIEEQESLRIGDQKGVLFFAEPISGTVVVGALCVLGATLISLSARQPVKPDQSPVDR